MSTPEPMPSAPAKGGHGSRYLFLFLVGLVVGVVGAVMALRALNARKDHFPESVMHVQQWHMGQLKGSLEQNRCGPTDTLPHVQSLRSHVKGLSSKDYSRLEGLHSLDFVLLFVPIEAAFSAALQAEPNLFQEAFDRQIVIVSPTTLLATLRVIDSLWKQERQSQNAREIAERAGWLYDKFVLFIQDLDELGSRLQQVDKAYAAARNKLCEGRGNLVSRSEQLKLLGARASKSLPADLLERAMSDSEALAEGLTAPGSDDD